MAQAWDLGPLGVRGFRAGSALNPKYSAFFGLRQPGLQCWLSGSRRRGEGCEGKGNSACGASQPPSRPISTCTAIEKLEVKGCGLWQEGLRFLGGLGLGTRPKGS